MKGKELLSWAKANLSEKILEEFSSGNGDVFAIPNAQDVFADYEFEIEELVLAEAEAFDWEDWRAYVKDKYSSEMETGDEDELRLFALRCVLEIILSGQ